MSNLLDLWRGNVYTPFRDLGRMQRNMDRAFDDWPATKMDEFNPTCELTENKTQYTVKFDVPGVDKKDIKIDLQDNQLSVSGERKHERKEDGKREHYSEMTYGAFMRSFTLPTPVNGDKAEAKFENGVLSIIIPKSEAARTRQVTIN